MKRHLKNRRNRDKLLNLTNLLAIGVLIIIAGAIFLYSYNEHSQDQIDTSYCGDFGFYGKSLTLFKDGIFKFSYHGCSPENGYISGNWRKNENVLLLNFDESDSLLNSDYIIAGNKLLLSNRINEEFVFCEEFIDQFERTMLEGEEKK